MSTRKARKADTLKGQREGSETDRQIERKKGKGVKKKKERNIER
jgi:hypothetical protein